MYCEYDSVFSSMPYSSANVYELSEVFLKIGNERSNTFLFKNCSAELLSQILQNYEECLRSRVPTETIRSIQDIKLIMSILSSGFELSLTKHDLIEKCINVYCNWMKAIFYPKQESDFSDTVRSILKDNSGFMVASMFSHFLRFFQSRKGDASECLKHHEALCNKILSFVRKAAKESDVITNEMWEYLLIFLMAANRQFLIPLTFGNDVADHLCDNLIYALFEIWTLACSSCNYYPSPSFWKSFSETCQSIRHRLPLIEQWNRFNFALTSRLLCLLYGPSYPGLKISNEPNLIPGTMSNNSVAQTWYRFFSCIGNPVELCKPKVVFKTIIYYKMITEDKLMRYLMEHPTLKSFPLIYWKAMQGIAKTINAFLGTSFDLPQNSRHSVNEPSKRAENYFNKGKDIALKQSQWYFNSSFLTSQDSFETTVSKRSSMDMSMFNLSLVENYLPDENRSLCDSIFHMFGKILFEASFLNRDIFLEDSQKRSSYPPKYSNCYQSIHSPLFDFFDAGQAEVVGSVCRILCSKKVSEEILPIYLSRSFNSLVYSVKLSQMHTFFNLDRLISNSLATILLNSSDLFCVNLKGVDVLFLSFVEALESVFKENIKFRLQTSKNAVRKSALQLLMSISIRPIILHNLKIQDLMSKEILKYEYFKWRIYDILLSALDKEKYADNIFLILSTVLLYFEELIKFQKNSTLYRSVERSASDLFLEMNLKICTNLVTIWKSDLNISLATLEFLSGLAHIKIPDSEQHCFDKETVRYLCEYIVSQCSRRPPAHSKDLHSTIVAAFYCCISWIVEYPRILDDKEYFNILMEVIELGISGTKSVDRINANICLKHDKELKPVSLRVKEAAEFLLYYVFEQVRLNSSTSNADSMNVPLLLDEYSLVRQSNLYSENHFSNQKHVIEKFRYFVVDSSTILAFLDEPLANDQDTKPILNVLVRNAFSNFAWTMQLMQHPRHRSFNTKQNSFMMSGRPVSINQTTPTLPTTFKYYPEFVEKALPSCEIDFSIPSLETINRATNDMQFNEILKISQLIKKQGEIEHKLIGHCDYQNESRQFANVNCTPPNICSEFESIRMFLSNFDLLPVDASKNNNQSADEKLKILKNNSIEFCNDLNDLDQISSKTFDTVHLFYVSKGAQNVNDILMKTNFDPKVYNQFLDFIKTLGTLVPVSRHSGWTGNIHSSWKKCNNELNKQPNEIFVEFADGADSIVYWTNCISEIAFVFPSCQLKSGDTPLKTSHLNDQNIKQMVMCQSNAKFYLVWLERFEDNVSFPLEDLSRHTRTGLELEQQQQQQSSANGSIAKSYDTFVIFVHLLDSGLVRVNLRTTSNRSRAVTPLMNGMVLSKNSFSFFVRQYVLNVSRRQRLDNEFHIAPHVRRRIKIQDIVLNHKKEMSAPELMVALFQKVI